MFSTPEEMVAYIAENDIEVFDIRFCDLLGIMNHLTVPASSVSVDSLAGGMAFDGSSIKGFQSIHESDMTLLPDVTTADTPQVRPAREHLGRVRRAAAGQDVDHGHVGEGEDRAEERRDRDQRERQRDRHLEHPPPVARPVDLGRLVEVGRDGQQAHHHDHRGQRRLVGDRDVPWLASVVIAYEHCTSRLVPKPRGAKTALLGRRRMDEALACRESGRRDGGNGYPDDVAPGPRLR